MARRKIHLADGIARVVYIETEATKGATLGTNLYLPNGDVANAALLRSYLGVGTNGQVASQHSQLQGLAANDHPQYPLAASLAAVAFSGSYTDLTDQPSFSSTLDGLTDTSTYGALDGDVLTYDSYLGLWTPAAPAATAPVDRELYYEDFNDLDGAGLTMIAFEASGSGATNAVSTVIAGRPGILTPNTGTTTTGYARGMLSNSGTTTRPHLTGSDTSPLIMEAEIRVPTLPDGTQTFSATVGFRAQLNANTALAACGIQWDSGGAAAAFYASTRTTAGASTTTYGGTTPVANTWYRLRLVVRTTDVKLYVWSGGVWVLQATITTDLPDAGMAPYYSINKSAGTTNRTVDIDWIRSYVDLAAGRPA